MVRKHLSGKLVLVFVLFYITFWIAKHYTMLSSLDFPLGILFLPIIGSLILYSGLSTFRKGKAFYRGGQVGKGTAIWMSMIEIAIALTILIFF